MSAKHRIDHTSLPLCLDLLLFMYLDLAPVFPILKKKTSSVPSSSSYSTGFYNSLVGFSLLILEVSRSHTMTQYSR